MEKRVFPDVMELFQSGVFLPKIMYSKIDSTAVRETVKMRNRFLNNLYVSIVVAELQPLITKWKSEIENGTRINRKILPRV